LGCCYDAKDNLVSQAAGMPDEIYRDLVEQAEQVVTVAPRNRPVNVKDAVVKERGFKTLRQKSVEIAEFF